MAIATTLPSAPGAVPVLGHALRLARDPLGFMSSLPTLGDLVRVRLGWQEVIVVCDPELTRAVLVDDRTYDKGGPFYHRLRELVGVGLGTVGHDLHRRHRRLCQASFHNDRLAQYTQVMADLVDTTSQSWPDGQTIEMSDEITALFMRIAVRTMFSATVTGVNLDAIGDDFATIARGLLWQMVMPAWLTRLPTPGNRRYHQVQQRLRRTADVILAQRRQDQTDHGDLLSSLIAAHSPDGSLAEATLTDDELVNEIFAFIIAGSETSSTTLLWTLQLLAHHPDIEQAVRDEVDTVLNGQPAALHHLPRLELTNRVVTETLRLHTPAWMFTRETTKATTLGDTLLPAGTTIMISPHLIHNRPDLYPQPQRFDPDRWLTGPSQQHHYIPFGAGARKCIGNDFALIETQIVLATILARWSIVPLSDILQRTLTVTQLPCPGGQRMLVTRRR